MRGIAPGTAKRHLERPVVRSQRLPRGMAMGPPRGAKTAERKLNRGGGKSAVMRYAERVARKRSSDVRGRGLR